jgi:hypothetical protein
MILACQRDSLVGRIRYTNELALGLFTRHIFYAIHVAINAAIIRYGLGRLDVLKCRKSLAHSDRWSLIASQYAVPLY